MRPLDRLVIAALLAAAMLAVTAAGASAAGHPVVIAEVQAASSTSEDDEFVELLNVSSAPVPLDGWALSFCDTSGPVSLVPKTIAPGQRYLIGTGTDADTPLAPPRLPSAGGGVTLLDSTSQPVDMVGYGTASACAEGENSPAEAPAAGQSIARIGDPPQDTGNNFNDFDPTNPTPQNAASFVPPGGGGGGGGGTDPGPGQGTPPPAPPPGGPSPPSTPAAPAQTIRIVALRTEPAQPRVGEPAELVVRASDQGLRLGGVLVDFGEPGGNVGASACRRPVFGREFRVGRPTTFRIPFAFTRAGTHQVEVTVISSDCTGLPRTVTQTIEVDVGAAEGPRAASRGGPLPTRTAQRPRTCANADKPVRPSTLRAARTAVLCLLNLERVKARRRPLRRNSKLERAASGHSRDMVRRRYFAHAVANGPTFPQRIRRVRYRDSAAENIGVYGRPTPRAMVDAWMASPPHRANILEKRYRTGGVGVAIGNPLGGSGATFTLNVGSARR